MREELYREPIAEMADALERLNYAEPRVYGQYLAQTYHYVSHSTRMLAFAAGRMPREDESHFRRFIRHIGEETSHELLAEKDLKDLGLTPHEFEQLPETRALWEPQYYKMERYHPLALMGYIIALEYFAGTHLPAFLTKLDARYGGKANRFVKLHAEEDPDHIDKAIELTTKLPVALQEIILVNVIQTARTYSAMTDACNAVAPESARWIKSFRSHERSIITGGTPWSEPVAPI